MVDISTVFVCHGQLLMVKHLIMSVLDSYCWYITRLCLSWTIMVGKVPGLSVMDNNGWYITNFCLSWTISMCL